MGERQGGRRVAGAVILVIGVLLLTGCSVERPAYQPVYDREIGLRTPEAPAEPELRTDDTSDEAEIQFRAAFVFYRQGKWGYAAAAFQEVLEYDDDRHDARFYLAASLALAGREAEAMPLLEELLETAYAGRARSLQAPGL